MEDVQIASIARSFLDQNADWRLLQNLYAITEAGSLRAASIGGPASLNTMRARLTALERMIGTKLVRRHVQGVELTYAGQQVVEIARAMHRAIQDSAQIRN